VEGFSEHDNEPSGSIKCWERLSSMSERVRSFIKGICPGPRLLENFCNKLIFYYEELLDPHPTPNWRTTPCLLLRLFIQYICNYPPYLMVQTGSEVHPTSFPMGTGALSPGVKRPGREVDYSPPTSAEVKKMWIYTSTPPSA
jgi:hypothetical protein